MHCIIPMDQKQICEFTFWRQIQCECHTWGVFCYVIVLSFSLYWFLSWFLESSNKVITKHSRASLSPCMLSPTQQLHWSLHPKQSRAKHVGIVFTGHHFSHSFRTYYYSIHGYGSLATQFSPDAFFLPISQAWNTLTKLCRKFSIKTSMQHFFTRLKQQRSMDFKSGSKILQKKQETNPNPFLLFWENKKSLW